MESKPKSDTLTTQVYRQVKQAILTCKLKPGQMVNESELILRYGVSKTPVREALKLLTQERLIQSVPGTCYLVTPVTVKDVNEIWDMRAILEEATARYAASQASETQLDQLEAKVGEAFPVRSIDDLVRWYDLNTEFHLEMAQISNNSRLGFSLRSVLEEVNRFLLLDPEMPPTTDAWTRQHRRIVAALREHDGGKAASVTLEDMRASRPRIQGLFFTSSP